MTEKDLAALVVASLQEQRWDVYQEVRLYWGSPIADIVATRGPLLWVIECKKTFGLDVLEQATHWTRYAHHVSVATPSPKERQVSTFKVQLLQALGIGQLHVIESYMGYSGVSENVPPALHRRIHFKLRDVLRDEHKTLVAAGGNRGGYYTPFKGTCEEIRRYVARHPGTTLAETLKNIPHHYSSINSGKAALSHLIQGGKVPGLRLERQGKGLFLYVKEMTEE